MMVGRLTRAASASIVSLRLYRSSNPSRGHEIFFRLASNYYCIAFSTAQSITSVDNISCNIYRLSHSLLPSNMAYSAFVASTCGVEEGACLVHA